ncbi:hypothetical protein EJ04DRAFT_22612 [Polyplosphaeria fusca]|uniref:Uncharacterized protein n=1 Tax=Polyplosphaeria fusca TaxID=682080 RepID=A0A9P4R3X9_9PLEO|nr:hypothetical protein EJ04DRAFT_22612 [Polyplosphaeria fusca]
MVISNPSNVVASRLAALGIGRRSVLRGHEERPPAIMVRSHLLNTSTAVSSPPPDVSDGGCRLAKVAHVSWRVPSWMRRVPVQSTLSARACLRQAIPLRRSHDESPSRTFVCLGNHRHALLHRCLIAMQMLRADRHRGDAGAEADATASLQILSIDKLPFHRRSSEILAYPWTSTCCSAASRLPLCLPLYSHRLGARGFRLHPVGHE